MRDKPDSDTKFSFRVVTPSATARLYLPYISPISPLYIPYISFRVVTPSATVRARVRVRVRLG